jgi:predicted nucleotide-binding protein (sugar kinase/HSP70/actin superfamily)
MSEQEIPRVLFTKEMKKTHTLLLPNMLPTHFKIIREIFVNFGYKAELLQNESSNVIAEGLKYVHNDMCYPAQLVIGQMIDALKSGKYDKKKVALVITQTGGGCRASNYIYLLRKALVKAEMAYIPVVSLNFGLEDNPGFKFTTKMLLQSVAAIEYGDIIALLGNQTRPYEVNKGETNALIDSWTHKLAKKFANNSGYFGTALAGNIRDIARDFAAIQTKDIKKIKVGVVGEIYIKFAPLGNNHLQDFLEEEGCEVMIPGLLGYFLYSMENARFDKEYYGGFKRKAQFPIRNAITSFVISTETMMYRTVAEVTDKFVLPEGFRHEKTLSKGIIDHGVKMGEGWLLSAEIMELNELGYPNIVCAQPFGCLPNHIVAKGAIRSITAKEPDINIVPIDYDPSTAKVNQENRIKLMLSVAREKLPDAVRPEKKKKEVADETHNSPHTITPELKTNIAASTKVNSWEL